MATYPLKYPKLLCDLTSVRQSQAEGLGFGGPFLVLRACNRVVSDGVFHIFLHDELGSDRVSWRNLTRHAKIYGKKTVRLPYEVRRLSIASCGDAQV